MDHETEKKASIKPSLNRIDVYIGNRLKKRRSFLGITQQDLAKSLKISFQQVQKYEKGSNRILPQRLVHLAFILGVPVQYFFEGLVEYRQNIYTGLAESSSGYAYGNPDPEIDELISSFMNISKPEIRMGIVAFLKILEKSTNSSDSSEQKMDFQEAAFKGFHSSEISD